jgi:hypothetical protein
MPGICPDVGAECEIGPVDGRCCVAGLGRELVRVRLEAPLVTYEPPVARAVANARELLAEVCADGCDPE